MTQSNVLDRFEYWELEAFADGVEMPHVAEVVQAYPLLWQDWLHSYHQEEQSFRGLYRIDCPSPELMRDYFWGVVENTQYTKIATHLKECLRCAEELRELSSLEIHVIPLAANEASVISVNLDEKLKKLFEHIQVVVAQLMYKSRPSVTRAALRSNDDALILSVSKGSMMFFEAGDVEISLTIRRHHSGQLVLRGQVLVEDIALLQEQDQEVRLLSMHSEIVSRKTSIDDVGEFSIDSVDPGKYQLHLNFAGRLIVIPTIMFE